MVVQNHHAGEQRAEVMRDHVFQRQESNGSDVVRGDDEKARQNRRNFDAGEVLVARLWILNPHREVERQSRNVGERVRGVDRQRCENGENLGHKHFVDGGAL